MNSTDTWFTPVLYRVSDNCRTIHDYDAPFILVVMMRMILKVASILLKFEYVVVSGIVIEELGTFLCASKVQWDYESFEV